MKTSARFLAMLLAVVMIASAALSVSAFSDVTGEVEHATAINVLAQLGVIGGYEDNTFKPEQNVTRAEMAKLVYVLYTTFVDAGAGAVKFSDVKADNWAAGYISWCASKGIIGGYEDNTFKPSNNVTYDEALKMVCGALGYNEWDPAQWPTDVRMQALSTLKLGKDMPATVKGADKLTRAQVAQIMYNALDADMKETKNKEVELVKDSGIMINLPVPKKLSEDVWKFSKVVYTVIGTENYGTKTNDEEKITLEWTIDEEDKTETFKLEELGLTAYKGNTDVLINLELVGIEKDEVRLDNLSVMGVVKDGVSISYTKAREYVTIDGVKYDAEDFAADAKYPIALYNVNGTKSDVVVFDDEEKLTTDFTNNILPDAQYLARTIDFNGDGNIDAFVVVPKAAYKVADITNPKNVKTVKLEAISEDFANITIPAADINIEVAEGDVVVAAQMGQKVYAAKVEPVDTYATKLNTKDGKVTLNEVGEVKFTKSTLGVADITINTADLGKENVDTYYIYNGEVILKDKVSTATDYTFAILRDVEETEAKEDSVSQTMKSGYIANVLVLEEGKLVLKKLALDPTVGAALIETYEKKAEDVLVGDTLKEDVIVYEYALLASFEENKDGYYDIEFAKDVDDEDYVIIPAGAKFNYNSKTTLYSVTYDTTTTGKIRLDADTVVFYKDFLTTTAAKGFTDMKFYTNSTLTTKTFEAVTTDVTVLAKDANDRLTLLATVVEKEIEGEKIDTKSYKNDGRLILFAPESSSVELVGDKRYNSYIFMNNETIETADAVIDQNKEYDKTTNPGTDAGFLYGYDGENFVYDKVVAATAPETIKAGTLVDVLTEESLIQYGDDNDSFIKVTSDVTIWGLADDEDLNVYATLTFDELAEMFELVKKYNEDNTASETIDLIMTYYYDGTEKTEENKVLSSIIVEIYEADEEDADIVLSVNDVIFDNYLGRR